MKELEREKKLLQREVDLRDDLHGIGDGLNTKSLVETEREIYETIKVGTVLCRPKKHLFYSLGLNPNTHSWP